MHEDGCGIGSSKNLAFTFAAVKRVPGQKHHFRWAPRLDQGKFKFSSLRQTEQKLTSRPLPCPCLFRQACMQAPPRVWYYGW